MNFPDSPVLDQLYTFNGTTYKWNGVAWPIDTSSTASLNAPIIWTTSGLAAPTFTTRSGGSKLVLYPAIGASSADYALGMETNAMWFSTATTSTSFKWYGGTAVAATLTGAGVFTATGDVNGQTLTSRTTVTVGAVTNSSANIELGYTGGSATTPYIDFHSGATAIDYDARIIASGGTGSLAGGSLSVQAATINLQGATVTNYLTMQSNAPNLVWFDTDEPANEKVWDQVSSSSTMLYRCVNDAYSLASNWMAVTRTAHVPTGVSLYPTTYVGLASANYLVLAGAPTTGVPTLYGVGTDTNVSLNLATQGTGIVLANGRPVEAWLDVLVSGTLHNATDHHRVFLNSVSSRQTMVKWSEDQTNAYWTATNLNTRVAYPGIWFDSTVTGTKIFENATNSTHSISDTSGGVAFTAGSTVTLMAFVVGAERNFCRLRVVNGANEFGSYFNVTAGAGTLNNSYTAGTGAVTDRGIINCNNNNVYLVWITGTCSGAYTTASFFFDMCSAANTPSYAGTTTNGILVGGMCATTGTRGAYIKSTDSYATAGSCVMLPANVTTATVVEVYNDNGRFDNQVDLAGQPLMTSHEATLVLNIPQFDRAQFFCANGRWRIYQ